MKKIPLVDFPCPNCGSKNYDEYIDEYKHGDSTYVSTRYKCTKCKYVYATPLIKQPDLIERRTTMTNNKTMYGLKLYIPFDDLDTYIHNHIDEKYKDHTFIPVKVEVNDVGLDIEITLMSANPIEFDQVRYKLDLEAMTKEN